MTEEERRIAYAVVRWIRIAHETGYTKTYEWGGRFWPTTADVDHSDLLRRLLAGEEPLPYPKGDERNPS